MKAAVKPPQKLPVRGLFSDDEDSQVDSLINGTPKDNAKQGKAFGNVFLIFFFLKKTGRVNQVKFGFNLLL